MPDIGAFDASTILPTFPLHFLKIIRYVSLLIVIYLVITPNEGGTIFLLLMGFSALLIVADVYGSQIFDVRFAVFAVRVLAVVVPVLMAGSGPDPNTRQTAGLIAGLGLPSIAIMLFFPDVDPSFR